jgi:hypothetical protein
MRRPGESLHKARFIGEASALAVPDETEKSLGLSYKHFF